MTKPLSTPARNALLQLYRLGFLWVDVGDEQERNVANELVNAKCAVIAENETLTIHNNDTDETTYKGNWRIEITLRGIQQAVMIYEDEQRAIRQLQRGSALGKVQ